MKFNLFWQDKGNMLKKLWLNQFAFSLFGIFVSSPFKTTFAILTSVFAYLFYMFTVGYAVLDDAQKDKISFKANRNDRVRSYTGFVYALLSFIPTIVLTVVYMILSFIPAITKNVTHILYLFNRFVLCGEILGIDMGLTNTVSGADFKPVNLGPDWAVFMSTHGIFPMIFAVVTPIILGMIYYLGFSGIVSINTTDTKKKTD